jgi:hypothetical protein
MPMPPSETMTETTLNMNKYRIRPTEVVGGPSPIPMLPLPAMLPHHRPVTQVPLLFFLMKPALHHPIVPLSEGI